MNKRLLARLTGTFLFLVLIAAACGSDATTTATATTDAAAQSDEAMADDEAMSDEAMSDEAMSDEMADEGHDDEGHGHDDGHAHSHGEPTEVNADLPTPSISVEAFEDPAGGWTVHAVPTNHTIAPLSASTEAVDGEGHMHLFVDDVRVGRIYNEWVQVGALGEGDHTIRVELSGNDHSALAMDGVIIDQTITVSETAGGHDHGHGGGDAFTIDATDFSPVPAITLEVLDDPKSGWNVRAVATGHTMAPLSVSTDHVPGEGHMHLYVDGEKVTRLYGEWYHLSGVTNGDHEVRVELSGNDHSPLAINGDIVDATVMITETNGIEPLAASDEVAMDDDSHDEHGDDEHGHDEHGGDEHGDDEHGDDMAEMAMPDADVVLTYTVNGDDISGDTGRQEVDLGSTVAVVVTSNVADDVHVHGYDIFIPVGGDITTAETFTADIPGIFEVELEANGELIFELQVR